MQRLTFFSAAIIAQMRRRFRRLTVRSDMSDESMRNMSKVIAYLIKLKVCTRISYFDTLKVGVHI